MCLDTYINDFIGLNNPCSALQKCQPGTIPVTFSSCYRPFLWGTAAASHHQVSRSLGPSLWQQPSVTEVLELLDAKKMSQSTILFPQTRLLQVCVGLIIYVSYLGCGRIIFVCLVFLRERDATIITYVVASKKYRGR